MLYAVVGTVIVTSPQTQNVTAGELFTLTCNATGYPVPSIEWTLNGTSYIIEDSSITTITLTEELRSNTSNLTVTSAMTNDTGIYECVATNVLNNDTQDANVTVQGQFSLYSVYVCKCMRVCLHACLLFIIYLSLLYKFAI